MSSNENLELIYNLERAWDMLYAIDKSANRDASRSQRIALVSATIILKDELGITDEHLIEYKVQRHSAIQGETR